MTIEVVNAFVDGPDLRILAREGSTVVERTFRPEYSFFVRTVDLDEDLSRTLRQSQSVVAMREEGPWTRICWMDEWVRRAMLRGRGRGEEKIPSPFEERGIPTFEGDVDPVRRWLTDTKDAVVAKPRRGYWDTETDAEKGIVAAKAGESRILSLAVGGEDQEIRVKVLEAWEDSAEAELIAWFFEEMNRFDQMLAWSGDDFDEPVLAKRSGRLLRQADVMRRKLFLDHLKLYRRMNLNSAESGAEKQSMKLQSIAMATVGEGKEEVPEEVARKWPGKSMGELSTALWREGGAFREKLGTYNAQDTRLLPKIEAVTGFAALFDTLSDVCRVFPSSRGLLPTQQMDGFMLRLGAERADPYHFPTREWKERGERDEDEDPFKGAFVMEPTVKGIVKNVHVADFASLYPSIILTWNMSPETKRKVEEGPLPPGICRCPMTGIHFTTEFDGILPTALREMIRLRGEWSRKQASLPPGTPESKEAARRSMAYKVAANSFYGVLGNQYSRYHDREVAESVTQNGVWLIKETIRAAEAKGMRVVYGDTDSFFAMGPDQTEVEVFVKWCNESLYPELLATVGCVPKHAAIKLAYEKAFDRVVMITKKRYFGRFLHYKGTPAKPVPAEGEAFDKDRHSRPEIKGLEYKRGDASVLARRLQERVIWDLMRGNERVDSYRKVVEDMLDYVRNSTLPIEEVSTSKSLSKKVDEYRRKTSTGKDAALPVHVRVAEAMAASGRQIGEGSRVSFVVVDGSDGIVAIPSEDYQGECDRFYLWENQIYPPTQRVLQAAFPDHNWVSGLEKIRPPKPPKPRARKIANASQYGLFRGDVEIPLKAMTEFRKAVIDSTAIVIDEKYFGTGTGWLEAIAEASKPLDGEEKLPASISVRMENGSVAVLTSAASSAAGVARARAKIAEFEAEVDRRRLEHEREVECARR